MDGNRKAMEQDRASLDVNKLELLAAVLLQIKLHSPLSSHLSILTEDRPDSHKQHRKGQITLGVRFARMDLVGSLPQRNRGLSPFHMVGRNNALSKRVGALLSRIRSHLILIFSKSVLDLRIYDMRFVYIKAERKNISKHFSNA